ncbi:hypothetical protein GCM10020255_023530 [Rhodococcus baikonurensis]
MTTGIQIQPSAEFVTKLGSRRAVFGIEGRRPLDQNVEGSGIAPTEPIHRKLLLRTQYRPRRRHADSRLARQRTSLGAAIDQNVIASE